MNDDYVITPAGFRRRSNVHLVGPGQTVSGAGGRLRTLNDRGEVVADLGPLVPSASETALLPAHLTRRPLGGPSPAQPYLESGWIVSAEWENGTGTPVRSFQTTWVVPPEPKTKSGQVIYLFNGIQNSTRIYQPVLQWGFDGSFGADQWCVASWYAAAADAQTVHSAAVPVSVGQTLVGEMTRTASRGAGFSYSCRFMGIPESALPITHVEELVRCTHTLEAYDVQQASDYPDADMMSFRAITIKTDAGSPTLEWTIDDAVTDVGQHGLLVSDANPGGEVDVYFRSSHKRRH